jgi:hypothetical protein
VFQSHYRYEKHSSDTGKADNPSDSSRLLSSSEDHSIGDVMRQLFNNPGLTTPSVLSGKIVSWGSFLLGKYNPVDNFENDTIATCSTARNSVLALLNF